MSKVTSRYGPLSEHSVSMISFIHRPCHCPVFDRFTGCKKQRERPGLFYHMNEIYVYLIRQRGGRGLNKRVHFAHTFFIPKNERYVFHFAKRLKFQHLNRNKKKLILLLEGPFPLSSLVDPDVIHMKKRTRPSPLLFHIASDQKLDGGKALE